jgi:hypothetical protein
VGGDLPGGAKSLPEYYSNEQGDLVGGGRQLLCRYRPKAVHGSGENQHFRLVIYEPAVVLFGQASLIMRNLRTKGRENVGWGYTNQTAEGQRE